MTSEDATCGFGAYGQLGHGDAQSRRWLTRVPQEAFAGAHVIQVACGNLHTMAVTAEAHAWTCGLNYPGQLSVTGDRARSFTFTQVDLGGARIAMAACGMHHSVVVSAEGRVWTWGCGQDGCLGLDDEQDMLVPRCCEGLHESTIVVVEAGGNHTAAHGECGNLWVWGDGSQGQLGLGNIEDRRVPTRVGAEGAFGGCKARMVACGGARTQVLTVSGELWVCAKEPTAVSDSTTLYFVRWHGLAEDRALAFAMGTHARLGAGVGGVGTAGRRR